MDLSTRRGDTVPLPRYQLVDRDGQPANLTGATVMQQFVGAPEGGSPCVIDGPAADGIVRLASRDHLPDPGDRRTAQVLFETEVTFASGQIQTFPTEGYSRWTVWADLDDKAAS